MENEYTERFQKYADSELIETFNSDVGNMGWVSARGRFHVALKNEFERRGFDYSAIGNRYGISLGRKIKLVGKKIEILNSGNMSNNQRGPSVLFIGNR